MAFKVAVTDDPWSNMKPFLSEREDYDIQVEIYQKKGTIKLIPPVRNADVIFVHHAIITKEIIRQLTHCKMIICPALGVDNIDGDAAAKRVFMLQISRTMARTMMCQPMWFC